jgi:hypothetical protein
MILANPWSLRLQLLAPLVALALGGCGGDRFAEFHDVPGANGGDASVSSATGGSGAQPSAVGGDSVVASSGSAAGGTPPTAQPSTAGGEPGAAGDGVVGIAAAGAPPEPPTELLALIDDVEGPFPKLPLEDGRNGGWYSVHDNSYGQVSPATAMALTPARGESHFAAGINGNGFTDWGAQLGVSLKSPATGYDASKYCGIRFMAKGSGTGWSMLVSDRSSVPQGGVCVEGSWDAEQSCYRFVGKTFDVGADWQEVKIRFDQLSLLMDPTSTRKLDPSAVYDILFNIHNPQGEGFELLVDDLAFIDCAG